MCEEQEEIIQQEQEIAHAEAQFDERDKWGTEKKFLTLRRGIYHNQYISAVDLNIWVIVIYSYILLKGHLSISSFRVLVEVDFNLSYHKSKSLLNKSQIF